MEEEHGYDINLDPVSFITVGTQGSPGERTFFLQAAQATRIVSLVIEKEQAIALAASIERMLAVTGARRSKDEDLPEDMGMNLLQPLDAAFRVAEMGLGVDEDRDVVILVAHEAPEDEPGQRARFAASFEQMQALSSHALHVVKQGRPVCPLCGQAMEPEGHFCPRSNGHHKPLD